jgi:hypothetical protein
MWAAPARATLIGINSRECAQGTRLLQRFVLTASLLLYAALATAQAPGKPLPAGAMQAKVKASCTTCHNISRITDQHLTRDQWSVQLDKMEGLGAVIPDGDRDAFLSYLTKNFGPAKGAPKPAAKKSGSGSD